MIRINDEDALTLSYALKLAAQVLAGDKPEALESFRVRVEREGRGDADAEMEVERLQNLLGYDA